MAQKYIRLKTLTGATPSWNIAKYKMAEIEATADVSISITGDTAPDGGILHFKQDATQRSLFINSEEIPVNPLADSITEVSVSFTNLGFGWNSGYKTGVAGSGLTPLDTPTLVMTPVSGGTAMDFDYTNVANESSYSVQIATNSGFTTGVQTASPSAGDNNHRFTGLNPETLYYGRVRAVGDGITYSNSTYGTDSETTLSNVENFDGVTPPAIPAGWTASSNIITVAHSGISSPNVLSTNSGALGWISFDTPQAATTTIEFDVRLGADTASVAAYLRSNLATLASSGNAYLASVYMGPALGNVAIVKEVAGSYSVLIDLNGFIAINTTYRVIFIASATGTTLTMKVQRVSDGFWMNDVGTFVSGVQTALAISDADVAAGGYSGIQFNNINGTSQGWIEDVKIS